MKSKLLILSVGFLGTSIGFSQTLLKANSPGNTYEDINAVLAPGYDAVETPDCVHSEFGRHINEVYDAELKSNVFQFIAHKTPDNDRCIKSDRQRVEIKTFGSSPDYLKATEGETVQYKWKFKLPSDFKVSSGFTHIHQVKAVGGPFESTPMITLTLRKGNPDRLELRYTSTDSQVTIKTANLDLLRGQWVDVIETIKFANKGSYAIDINRVSDSSSILSYSNSEMDTWQDGAEFSRPKWGIYRSLKHSSDLQDEIIRFADFSIEEFGPLSVSELEANTDKTILVSVSSKQIINFKASKAKDYDALVCYDALGTLMTIDQNIKKDKLDVSGFNLGPYYLVFMKLNHHVKVLKFIVK